VTKSRIFIPKTCRVGFQHRKDTFTGMLAYVIYYDALGKIRKEKSWKGWCHLPGCKHRVWQDGKNEQVDGIEPQDFENVPTSGFVLNKGIRRFNWSHFGSGRSMIRIYDPRGYEFEVTPENLIGLLMHTDCSRREIQGELVYAWHGTELMLLPCNSEEYEAAKNFTQLQAKKVGARELKEGLTYVTKSEEHLVYVGRHKWFAQGGRYEDKPRKGVKCHIFCDLEGKKFRPIKSVPSTIAAVANDQPHDEISNWIDSYLASKPAAEVVEWIKKPLTDKDWDRNWDHHNTRLNVCMDGTSNRGTPVFVEVSITQYQYGHGYYGRMWSKQQAQKGDLVYHTGAEISQDGTIRHHYRCNDGGRVIDKSKFFKLQAKMSNGLILDWS